MKWDLSKIDRKEIDFFTAAATLHHQGIPTVIPLRNNGPTPDLRQQKRQDFAGEADLTLDHELDKMDYSFLRLINHQRIIASISTPVTEATAPNAIERTF